MAWSRTDTPTVMIVDDIDAVRIVLRMQLTILGYRVLEARDMPEAVELCVRERPNLILMDVGQPEVEGLGASSLLQVASESGAIPVVALSAFSDYEFRARALEAGCRDVAAKPLGIRNLGELIARNL
jgi:CheY-like chemotaxis protein